MIDLVVADRITAMNRYEICKRCPHFKPKFKKCDVCGCFMKLKTKIIFTECPIGKW